MSEPVMKTQKRSQEFGRCLMFNKPWGRPKSIRRSFGDVLEAASYSP